MGPVRGRLELERAVLHVEVPGQALGQTVEHPGAPAISQSVVGHDDVSRQYRAGRSSASTHAGRAHQALRASRRCGP